MASHRFKSEIVDKLISDELEDYINQQIAELPPQCQKAFSLSRKEHLSNKEIAQEMGISVSTVKTYIARSLDKIREALKKF
jgi:RNA polymerase sigma-70 factor (ECF subfamily)